MLTLTLVAKSMLLTTFFGQLNMAWCSYRQTSPRVDIVSHFFNIFQYTCSKECGLWGSSQIKIMRSNFDEKGKNEKKKNFIQD